MYWQKRTENSRNQNMNQVVQENSNIDLINTVKTNDAENSNTPTNVSAENTNTATNANTPTPTNTNISSANTETKLKPTLELPLNDALKRVTKKTFGLKVSPGNSPVSPEKFSGYHTGVDFETTAAEANTEMPVYAVCSGKLLQKKTATGYGGIAVQSCKLNGQDVTVIYGHLKLSSISAKTGDTLTAGKKIGILGKGYSSETSGERKHLHLGIHKGGAVNIKGYVQTSAELTSWFNALEYMK